MGCFDSNCCVTGLPMHSGDPVRAALLVAGNDQRSACYVGDNYLFWTMPVSSTYNDYGDIEFEGIADKHRWSLEHILTIMLPGMKDHEEYSREVLEGDNKLTLEGLWENIIRQKIDFDPDRELNNEWTAWAENGSVESDMPKRQFGSQKVKFMPWMCHEWAYQEVLDIYPGNDAKIRKQADAYCYTHIDFDAELEGVERGENASIEDQQKFGHAFSSWQHTSCHSIEGSQGGISEDVRRMLNHGPSRACRDIDQTEFIAHREEFKERLVETALFCSNLYFIRRILTPMNIFGEQYDRWDNFPAWTALIAKKAAEKKRKYDSDYGEDEDEIICGLAEWSAEKAEKAEKDGKI
jgi:hypothetical protein